VDIKQVYKEYAAKGQDDATKLGWNDKPTQDLYMGLMVKLVSDHMDLRGKTVHDAGCGYGDLIPHLEKVVGHAPIASYIGTDLLEESVAEAAKRYTGYHFFQRDLLVDDVPKADVTICMGALAFHRAENVVTLLDRLWAASSTVLAFNCWWNLTPAYVGYWQAHKAQKRVQSWLKNKQAAMLSGYDPSEAMFLVVKRPAAP
jgi:SAM-dependent methyltransferase